MNELILGSEVNDFKPPVKSTVLKKKHATRGIRLIHYESLIDYLNQLADEAALVDADPSQTERSAA